MEIEELKQEYVESVYRTKALLIKEEPFDLKSGGRSHIYLNHRVILTQYRYLKQIAEIYLKLLEGKVDNYKLCTVDSLMSPIIVGAMAALNGKDIVRVGVKELAHGTKEYIYGDATGEVVIIDDMTSTGSIMADAAKKIREHGGVVRYAVVSSCRDDSAKEKLKEAGVELLYIFNFKEILKLLEPQLTDREKEIAREEFS